VDESMGSIWHEKTPTLRYSMKDSNKIFVLVTFSYNFPVEISVFGMCSGKNI